MADCAAPANPGVRICSPTQDATVVWVAQIDFNSTPSLGAQIVKFSMYDNNHKFFEDSSGSTGTTWGDGDGKNGFHRVVINAWDSNGNLYQRTVSFRVIGNGFPDGCAAPSSPGINLCVPPAGTVLGTTYPVDARAKGNSQIAAIRVYVDGKAQLTQFNLNQLRTDLFVGTQGDHRVSFVAWDNSGHVFKSSRTIRSTYTYGFFDCTPKGPEVCTPGFYSYFTTMPAPESYVDSSFTIMTEIRQNPRPITTMKAYVDNRVVATSNGPAMIASVENAPSGTHILTLQAWDTAGVLYRVQYNININVSH